MEDSDYNTFAKELNSIRPAGVKINSSRTRKLGKTQYIITAVTSFVVWVVLTVWTPGWLKNSDGKRKGLLIFIFGLITGLLAGAGAYMWL